MAIKRVARPVSVAFTLVAGSSAKSFTEIQSAEIEDTTELPEFLTGNSLVNSTYQGVRKASITFETANLVDVVGLTVGAKVTAVKIIAQAAVDSGGTAAGDNISRTMSKGVIAEITQPSLSNADKKPVTMKVKIALDRHEGDTEDPTFSAWATEA